MSWLELGQMIGHGFAKLTGAQRDAGATSPVAARGDGSLVLPDGTAPTKGSVGLGNVDNTSDANKLVSTAQQTALNAKVSGPASATDNAIARFDSTTGKLVQNSSATIDDSGNATFSGNVTIAKAGSDTVHQLTSDGGTAQMYQSVAGDTVITNYANARGLYLNQAGNGNIVLSVNGAERLRITDGTSTFNNSTGFGYGAGSGGTVTQVTSKSTAVTLNKPSGRITMHNAALAAGAEVVFLVSNSSCASADTVTASLINTGGYALDHFMGASGQFYLRLKNVSGSSLSEAVQIQFNIIKGSTT